MPFELTKNDYINILNYYKLTIPKSKRLIQKNAEQILAEKLCRCIKKVDSKFESRAIGICTKTIINNKGYNRGKFNCKKNLSVKISKNNKVKTKRNN